MSELILSDITVMGAGYCVIGLEKLSADSFRSVRPIPPRGFAWPQPFKFNRGDVAHFEPRPTTPTLPHREDLRSNGLSQLPGSVREEELVGCLQKAEVSPDLEGLFGCQLESDTHGGNSWVKPERAGRSICGCEYGNIRFRLFMDSGRITLRARLLLLSDESLASLPVVDREWRRFIESANEHLPESRPNLTLESFLNRSISAKLLDAPQGFARIGLARAEKDGKCWLMLDSLFPQPKASWLEEK